MKRKRPDMVGNNYAKGHKPLAHYFKKGNKPSNKLPEGTPSWYNRNKDRVRKTHKAWKLSNPEKAKNSQHRAAKKNYDLKRALVTAFKNKPCSDCGQSFHFSVMDLDHVRGRKLMAIGANIKSMSVNNLLKELEKCDVVCSNCHRLRTWSRLHNGILTSES
jgi:hypothetical protein